MFIDKVKMDVVSDLIDLRPNLHTVILDISVLTYPASFLADWLFRINRLKLKFLNAQKVEDIKAAFKKMDVDDDGRISTSELSSMCGSGTIPFFNYKYGPNFKVPMMFLSFKVLLRKSFFTNNYVQYEFFYEVTSKFQIF